ncbi:MAG: hypothetical protein HWE15_10845 [Algoriphagus sp.]|uniref:hypothetical protein n=1 Tax=Algoriphagus sp. TaxID=1872435 RepID=UPI0018494AD5|nr:hypothetical protein [Algoriphagus sp.]NVJ86793.1 hypothetical protein [Algoriphagus sp.]
MKVFFSRGLTPISWACLMLIALVIVLFLPWRFQVNDDEAMMWLISGSYTGEPESYAVFIHPIMSWVLAKLYRGFPNFPWYPIIWFSILYFSFLAVVRLNHQKFGKRRIAQIWNLLFFAFILHFAFFLQFSIVSALALSAGLAYRFWRFSKEDLQIKKWFKSDVLILLGFLVRPEVGYLLIAGFVGFGIIFGWSKFFLRAAVIPLILFLIGSAFSLFWIQKADKEEFVQLNHLRSAVFDHPFLQLEKEYWKLEKPDLYYFSNGLQDFEQDRLDAKVLSSWKQDLDQARIPLISFSFYKKALFTYIEKEHFFIFLWIVLILYSIAINSWKSALVSFLIFAGFLVLAPFFLLKVQIYALAFLLFAFFMILIQNSTIPISTFTNYSLLTLLILAIGFHLISFFKSFENIPEDTEIQNQLTLLEKEEFERIFLIGEHKFYHELVFQNPLPFQIMGWPSLLNSFENQSHHSKTAYLVQKNTFRNNIAYFEARGGVFTYLEDFVLVKIP